MSDLRQLSTFLSSLQRSSSCFDKHNPYNPIRQHGKMLEKTRQKPYKPPTQVLTQVVRCSLGAGNLMGSLRTFHTPQHVPLALSGQLDFKIQGSMGSAAKRNPLEMEGVIEPWTQVLRRNPNVYILMEVSLNWV